MARARYNKRFEDGISPEPNSGCWLFDEGESIYSGYVRIFGNRKRQLVHRFAYERYRGSIPPGMCVCHTCDVRCCVNPDHLFLGTHAENIADRNQKGRQARGAKSGRAKLTAEQVLAIRATTTSPTIIARQYGITAPVVHNIRRRRIWMHL